MTRPDPPTRDPGRLLRDAPATHRNREPILEEIARWLPPSARVLEIASGTGQHAVFFAERMPGLTWLPTDGDPGSLDAIEAWIAESGVRNVEPPRLLDASRPDWARTVGPVDAIFNANMIHIAPWEVALGLFEGAGRALAAGGRFLLYGPFKVGGVHTAESNASFDESLKSRDARWGVRDLERVAEIATAAELTLVETNEMPANNKLLVFERE